MLRNAELVAAGAPLKQKSQHRRLCVDFEWPAVVFHPLVSKEDLTMRASNARGFAPRLVAWGWPLAGVIFTTLLLISASALPKQKSAQPAAVNKGEDRVETRLREADRAYAEDNFARALELYRQVDTIDPMPKTRLKIADCLRELGQLSEAYAVLEGLLKDAGTTLDPKDKERAEQALAKLRSTTSVLVVQVSEQDARVVLDGVEMGRGPLNQSLRRKPGHVSLSVTKSGFEPWSKEIDLTAAEEQSLKAELVPEKVSGTLVVHTTGKNAADLILDGKDVGPLPWTGDVPPGAHEVTAKGAYGISATRKIAVSAKGRTELELTIVENPAKLRVTSADARAIIRIDGTPYGSGKFDGDIVPGKHAVSVEQPGFVPSVYNLALEPGEQKILENVVLERSATSQPVGGAQRKKGLYSIVSLDGLIGKSTNSIAASCPATGLGGSCSSWPNFGSEVDLHVGYSFGIFGVEGFMLGGTNLTVTRMQFPRDVSQSESAWYGIAHKERYLVFEPIFGGGAAGRVSTQGKSYRLSTALGLGLAYRTTELQRKVDTTGSSTSGSVLRKDSNSYFTSGDGRVIPMFVWDSDLQLGDTPGTRVFLGIHSQVEFGSEPQITPLNSNLGFDATSGNALPLGSGPVEIRRSPAFFIGPRFGVVIGH